MAGALTASGTETVTLLENADFTGGTFDSVGRDTVYTVSAGGIAADPRGAAWARATA